MNWYPPEIQFLWDPPQYFGPGTDLSVAGTPVSNLDAIARDHDISYSRAGPGHAGSVQRAKADYQMALDAGGLTGAWMLAQATFRVLTFNQITLPWD